MDDALARSVFEEIRDRPYRIAPTPEEKADNCYFKGTELIQKLTGFGYKMRGRLGDIDWHDGPYPHEVLALLPPDTFDTHFYPEIYMDGEWKILDPSLNKSFAQQYGMPYSEFGADNESCFTIRRLFDFDEQAAYTNRWLTDDQFVYDYQSQRRQFFESLNDWFERVNP